jgi:polyhydroxyalkanoate synthesis regulator phasin
MPQTPDFGKYLNAGAEFVAVTRAQARKRANDLVAQGQLAQDQVQGFVDGLVEESRRRTDVLAGIVRQEIQRQVKVLGIATKDDLARLEARLAKQAKQAKAADKKSTGKPTGKQATGKKVTGKKAATKSATTGKKAAKPAKPSGAKKSDPQAGSAAPAS